jgi:hypothetical protein
MSKRIVLFARAEGKLGLKNTKIKRISLVMSKASKYTNVKIVQIALKQVEKNGSFFSTCFILGTL